MIRFKKIVAITLVFVMLVSIDILAFAINRSSNEYTGHIKYTGHVEYLDKKVYTDSNINYSRNVSIPTINFEEVDILIDNTLQLTGMVTYNSKQMDFNLVGNLYKATLEKDNIIGDVIDEKNNFDVIHFSIVNESNGDKFRINHSLINQDVIKIYLLEKATNAILSFEVLLNELTAASICGIYNHLSELEDITKEHWWINVYSPTISSEEDDEMLVTSLNIYQL